ncbi:MAG: hypothetical protein PSV35_02135 [bacterium]|nr:hypothetical protein [bacterium]
MNAVINMPVSKELTQPLSNIQLKWLLENFALHLPDELVINNQKYKKCSLLIGADRLILKSSGSNSILILGQGSFEGVSVLVSDLSEEDFSRLVMSLPKNSAVYYEFFGYTLLDVIKRLGQTSPPALHKLIDAPVHLADTNVETILKKNQGVLYFQHHLDLFSWHYIIRTIKALKTGDITHFYLELPHEILAPLFHLYNQTGDSQFLRRHLQMTPLMFPILNTYFVSLCEVCYEKKIKIIPVDKISELDNVIVNHEMVSNRDEFMAMTITKSSPRKFMGLFGLAHYGLANLLHVPSIGIMPQEGSKKLAVEPLFTKEESRYINSLVTGFSQIRLSPIPATYSCRYFPVGLAVAAVAVTISAMALSV